MADTDGSRKVYCRFVLMKNITSLLLASCLFLVVNTSCKKDSFITSPDASLRLSADSVKFDTVFTRTGSVTQSFKIVNENDQPIRLSKVKLGGGPSSSFKININGIAAPEVSNIDIASNDSIYVFVSVFVNPSAANLSFIISDSIAVEYNGNVRWVQLEAYGQNANFQDNVIISTNSTWTNDRPYVILGSLQVAPNVSLTINRGTKVYSHANAPIIVDGSLIVNGTATDKVMFTGDRLDAPYNNLPASWPGIIFRSSSKSNTLIFTEIKNAYQALVLIGASGNTSPKLLIQQCIIDNAYNTGIFCSNSSVKAENVLISNSGNNILIESGGTYSFTHCTVASFSNNYILHKTPVLSLANFSQSSGPATQPLQALFTNCIFWGDNGFIDNEVLINKQGTTTFNVTLDHCLYRAPAPPANATIITSILNQDPVFDSIDNINRYYDFRHNNSSIAPGVNKGISAGLGIDLDSRNRNVGVPDIGAYEKQ
jgi:hypothetical protein